MKFIYPIIIVLFIVSTSQAQLLRGYGFKVGATLASEDWDYKQLNDFQPDSRWGFNIGVFCEFLNIPYFSVVTEFNYVQKGMSEDIPVTTITQPDGTGEYITWDTRVDYLDLSALGKLRFDLEMFLPYILLGPKIDFEIAQEHSLGSANIVEENFNEVMYGFKIGIGGTIKINTISLLAEILYDYDINDLYEGEYLTVTSNSVDFRLGIMF